MKAAQELASESGSLLKQDHPSCSLGGFFPLLWRGLGYKADINHPYEPSAMLSTVSGQGEGTGAEEAARSLPTSPPLPSLNAHAVP